MKRIFLFLLVVILVGFGPASAYESSVDADDILKNADEMANNFKDLAFKMVFKITDKDGNVSEREVMVYQKGPKRMTKFVAPASDRNMGFLALDQYTSFVYLPAYNKVRRIASHVRNQTFMGTDMTYEDMSRTTFREYYIPELKSQNDTHWELVLMPKPDAKVGYAKLELKIHKQRKTIDEVHYFQPIDQKIKMEIREKFMPSKNGEYFALVRNKCINLKESHQTIMEMFDPKVDQNINDDIFTKRFLKRPVR